MIQRFSPTQERRPRGPVGKARLSAYIRRHNQWVVLLVIMTFCVSVILWIGLYLLVWWLFLLGGTAARSLDFQPAEGPLARGFMASAILLCAFAWIVRRMRPNVAPKDHTSLWEHLLDIVLALPRVTLSIFGTGGAMARLKPYELEYAWELLRQMDDADAPMPIQSAPLYIPDDTTREKIILALQLCGLIELRPTRNGPVLAFQNKAARRVAQENVRLTY